MNKLTSKLAQIAMMGRAGKKTKKKQKKKIRGGGMGPVSSISTAPVAIGNSITGSTSKYTNIQNGVRVVGRDFMFTPVATGSIATWTMVGGTPLSPAAFVDSRIREFQQVYQKYRWKKFCVHYITSSPTSSSGDVMFYYAKNRDSVFLNQTSNFLLPYVISDSNTVLGPQWTNHSACFAISSDWKSTDYGMEADVNEYADGEVFLLSKTVSTDSPGYVLFDYEIEFAGEQVSPRLLTLPLARIQYNQLAVKTLGVSTQGVPNGFVLGVNNLGGAQSSFPSGFSQGDIYKVVVDVTNSTFTAGTASNLLEVIVGGTAAPVVLSDGFTCYAVATNGGILSFYPNTPSAFVANSAAAFQWGSTASFNVNLQIWISLVSTGMTASSFVSNF
jgi:hypothetical protein